MSADRTEPAASAPGRPLVRRIFSITGLLPVGGFLLLHIYTNTFALLGREAFDEKVGDLQKLPHLLVLELAGVMLPLLVHTLLGLLIVLQDRRDGQTPARGWMFILQRATGMLAFAFICFHLYEYWVPRQLGSMPWQTFYTELGQNLAVPWRLAVYSIGVTSAVFHFAYGIWTFAGGWGLVVGPGARRRLAIVCGVFGVALWFLSMNIVLKFATGAALLPIPAREDRRPGADGEGSASRPAAGPARPRAAVWAALR